MTFVSSTGVLREALLTAPSTRWPQRGAVGCPRGQFAVTSMLVSRSDRPMAEPPPPPRWAGSL